MDKQSVFDRGLVVPILVGLFSVCGICFLLAAMRFNPGRSAVATELTSTPFQYLFIGTEPVLSTGTVEDSSGDSLPTDTPDFSLPSTSLSTPIILPSRTSSPGSSLSTLPALTNTRVPTSTPTSASTAPLGAGTYDDTHNRLVYSGDWETQTNVTGANLNTLHVSSVLNTPRNSVSFQFIGQEIRIFYQAGVSLGTISLNIDNTVYEISENNASTDIYEWVIPQVAAGTHTVVITHIGGGSVNIDKIIIPDATLTATVTATVTP